MRIGLVAMLALALCACGSKTPQGADAKTREAAATARELGDDQVAAVLDSQGTPPAKLRFVLDSRPVLGQPFNLKILVSAAAPVPRLVMNLASADFTIDPASVTLALGQAGGGSAENSASHDFSVTARQDGLTELAVRLTTDADAAEAVYVIPVLVAKPGPADKAGAPVSDKPDPAAAGDHGQPKKG